MSTDHAQEGRRQVTRIPRKPRKEIREAVVPPRREDLRLFQVERSERTGAKLGDDGWQQESGLAGCSPDNFFRVASWWWIEGGFRNHDSLADPVARAPFALCRLIPFILVDRSPAFSPSFGPSLPLHPPISAGCLDVRWMCPGTKSRRRYTWLSPTLLQICFASLVWTKKPFAVGV